MRDDAFRDNRNHETVAVVDALLARKEEREHQFEDIWEAEGKAAAYAHGNESGQRELSEEVEALWADFGRLEATLAHVASPVNGPLLLTSPCSSTNRKAAFNECP
jgi:hypothetical protein